MSLSSLRALPIATAVALGTLLLVLAPLAGHGGERADAAARASGLKAFRSCDQLRGYLRDHRRALTPAAPEAPGGFGGGGPAPGGGAPGPGAAAPDSEQAPPSSPTNVQEAGIDEPDIVKTDGTVLLVLAGATLHAVELGEPVPRLLDSLELEPPGRGQGPGYFGEAELLVANDRALVIVSGYPTTIYEVDLRDPADLRVARTMTADGSYVDARLHGSSARVVVSAYPELPAAEEPARAWMPKARLTRKSGKRTRARLLGCRHVRRPRPFSGAGMLTVLTIDLRQGLPAADSDAVMTQGEIAYASRSSLYVATERWQPTAPPPLPPAPPGAGGTPRPARQGGAPASEVTTAIHRFALDDERSTRYVASGEVTGYMLSQWSMSEHDGVLRVASTTAPPWQGADNGPAQSLVTVLDQRDDRLAEIGRVGGLGRGERIYAVRFIGDVGFVVTFRQVDPLYALDLSDPTDPRVRGELKVPGYSAYLHPVGEGRLLGVGQSATDEGRVTGSQVSLFDISNLDAPSRLDQEEFGEGSSSEVEHNHRAFLFAPEHALAVMPLVSFPTGPGDPAADDFYGAVGFRISPDAIASPTRLSHGDSFEERIRRALIAEGALYTVSAAGVMVHDVTTLERTAFLRF